MQNPVHLLKFSWSNSLPLILQSEIAECGLAAIAMVAGYHGLKTDLNVLRHEYPASLKGLTLTNLMHIAHDLGFSTRPLRLELETLKDLDSPYILHWNMSHFVVLKSANSAGLVIHDPAKGVCKVSWEDASVAFTGVALEMHPTKDFVKKTVTSKLSITQLWSVAHGLTKSLVTVLCLSLALQLFMIFSPLYMQLVIDDVLVSNNENLLAVLVGGFLFLTLITVAVSALRSLVILHLSNQLSIQVAANLFNHLLKLPMEFFERRHIGDIVSRFGSLDHIRQQLTTGVVEAVVDGLMVIGTMIMMWFYSSTLSLIVFLALGGYFLFRVVLFWPIRRGTDEQISATAKKDSNFLETVRAVQGIKLYGMESQREALWHNHYADSLNAGIKLGKLSIGYNSANQLISGLESIFVVFIGALSILEGVFTIGALIAFIAYKNQFSQKASALIDKWFQFKMLGLHIERVSDIALASVEGKSTSRGVNPSKIMGEIELRNVSFKYNSTDAMLLKSVSLVVRKGESVAIVGPSGCGKTTLLKIMLGLVSPTEGEIYFDGHDINDIGYRYFRKNVSSVMQEDSLLSGTIAENITFFSEHVDMNNVEKCAKLAAVHSDISKMPMGYNSLVGDMGSTLSGGQKQRLLLARALYRKPSILFLDEATSSLDIELEAQVNSAIRGLNVTRIIIAHRPETISSADRVLYIDAGNVIEKQDTERLSVNA